MYPFEIVQQLFFDPPFGLGTNTMDEFQEHIDQRVGEFTPATVAKPFKWTYKGRPLTVYSDGLFLPSTTRLKVLQKPECG
jgi:hypothetical protein